MAKVPEKYYRTFAILKKNGTRREITAPRVFFKKRSSDICWTVFCTRYHSTMRLWGFDLR